VDEREREIATERVERLRELAAAATRAGDEALARRYVRRARRIAERHRLEFPRRFERFSCAACDRYLLPGRTARVRLRKGHVVVTCDCGHHARYPYRPREGDEDDGDGDDRSNGDPGN
jgi:ribonuclease P protein subunit RPR2